LYYNDTFLAIEKATTFFCKHLPLYVKYGIEEVNGIATLATLN